MARELGLGPGEIRAALALKRRRDFESTALYRKVLALADARGARPVPRAILPVIELHTPKTKRRLTTRWFAERVAARHQECLARR